MSRSRRAIAVALVVVVLGVVAGLVIANHNGKHTSNNTGNTTGNSTGTTGPGGTAAPSGTVNTAPIANLSRDAFGISTGVQLYTESSTLVDSDITGIAKLGAKWMRTAIRWDLVEPKSASADDWAKADQIVSDGQKNGLNLILNITGTPPWARGPGAGPVQFPPDLNTYATFTGKIAARYKGKVAAYELGNEPNHTKSFATPDPKLYEQVLQLSYPEIKRSDPNVKVLSAGLGGIKNKNGVVPGDVYLKALYAAGAKPYFDGVAYHPYSYPQLPSSDPSVRGWSNMLRARNTMVANGDSAKKIWVTEYGAPTNGPNAVNQEQQAALMYAAYKLWAGYPWAGPLCWFDYRDKGTDTSDHGNFFGFYSKSGQPKLVVKQYEALVQSAR
jgi:hypothetical protein